MFTEVIVIFKAVNDSFSINGNPGLIPYFAPPRCTLIFLWLLPIFSSLNVLGGKTACIVPTSSGWWSDVSTLGCRC